jgi:ankyrin repeat protein
MIVMLTSYHPSQSFEDGILALIFCWHWLVQWLIFLLTFAQDGATALNVACQQGYFSIADMLIKAGANVNTPDRNQTTPLLAAASNPTSCVTVISLVKAGAEVNAKMKVRRVRLVNICWIEIDKTIYFLTLYYRGALTVTTNVFFPFC